MNWFKELAEVDPEKIELTDMKESDIVLHVHERNYNTASLDIRVVIDVTGTLVTTNQKEILVSYPGMNNIKKLTFNARTKYNLHSWFRLPSELFPQYYL